MGQSPSTDFAYGFYWENEHELFPDEDAGEYWKKAVLASRGMLDPRDSMPEGVRYGTPEFNEWKKQVDLDGYRDALSEVEEEFDIHVDTYGTDMFRGPYVCVKSTTIHSYDYATRIERGSIQKIVDFYMQDDAEARALDKLSAWFEATRADRGSDEWSKPVGPCWFMATFYG